MTVIDQDLSLCIVDNHIERFRSNKCGGQYDGKYISADARPLIILLS